MRGVVFSEDHLLTVKLEETFSLRSFLLCVCKIGISRETLQGYCFEMGSSFFRDLTDKRVGSLVIVPLTLVPPLPNRTPVLESNVMVWRSDKDPPFGGTLWHSLSNWLQPSPSSAWHSGRDPNYSVTHGSQFAVQKCLWARLHSSNSFLLPKTFPMTCRPGQSSDADLRVRGFRSPESNEGSGQAMAFTGSTATSQGCCGMRRHFKGADAEKFEGTRYKAASCSQATLPAGGNLSAAEEIRTSKPRAAKTFPEKPLQSKRRNLFLVRGSMNHPVTSAAEPWPSERTGSSQLQGWMASVIIWALDGFLYTCLLVAHCFPRRFPSACLIFQPWPPPQTDGCGNEECTKWRCTCSSQWEG